MQNLLPKTFALILVAGGFAATGDLAWMTGLGLRLVNARTIPSEERPLAAAPEASAGLPPLPTAPSPPPMTAPAAAASARVAATPAVLPPTGGPDTLAVDTLSPGDRLIVWLAAPAAAVNRPWFAFDLIDPVRLEAIVQDSSGSPRRVRLQVLGGRGSTTTLAKGLSLRTTPIGIAHTAGQTQQPIAEAETIGPITAFAVTAAD